jgi:DNA-binding NtrC family response regulator
MEILNKRKKKFLVVDDDRAMVEGVSMMLEAAYDCDPPYGITFSGIGSMHEVIGEIYAKNYDLLISDIMMPEINGLQLTKEIRSRGLNIPIVLMTGNSWLCLAFDSMKFGADDFLLKPFNFEELVSSIILVLRKTNTKIIDRRYYKQSNSMLMANNEWHSQCSKFPYIQTYYYETGEIMAEIKLTEDKLEGTRKLYRTGGKVLVEVSFWDGKVHGRTKWFRSNGRVCKVENY